MVIPAYNAARTINSAIESAVTQTVLSLEVIVVDDGSQDETGDLARRFEAPVRCFRQENLGAAAARNKGIAEARGDFIAFLDADDVWLPEKLERQIALFETLPDAGAVQCGAVFVDEALRPLEVRPCRVEGDPLWDVLHFRNLPAFLSAVVLRRACLDRLGGFDPSLVILEEWDMAIRTARHCGLASLAEPLVLYRVHRGNRSRNVDIHVTPGLAILGRLFSDPALSPRIRAARREIYGTFYRMLAGGYFRAGKPAPFMRWAARAISTDPGQVGYMLAWPGRVVRRRRTTS